MANKNKILKIVVQIKFNFTNPFEIVPTQTVKSKVLQTATLNVIHVTLNKIFC